MYAKGGRIEQADGVRYVHDADGQLVEKVLPDGREWRYMWDLAGQLVEVTRPDGQKVRFAYDALGRRVRKSFAGKATRYVWDGNDLVHEVADEADAVTWVFEPGSFAPLAKEERGKRYGVVTDHIGTPRMMADEAGALAWKAQLDMYGVARNDVAATRCPWRWPGQYEDEETGLHYNRFRYYDPEAGRYICQDPIGLNGGMQSYAYTHDPLSWTDPFGLSRRLCAGKTGAQLEAEVERDPTAAGVPITNRGQKFYDAATGRLLGEIDVEVPQAIIEVTTETSGKLPQLQKYFTPLFNPGGKPVILFAPDYGGAASRAAEQMGVLVVRFTNDLAGLVK